MDLQPLQERRTEELTDLSKVENHFELPKEYVERLKLEAFDTGSGWCLIEYFPQQVVQWQENLKNLYPSRNVFPFAKRWANDDVACFDLDDFSGDPKVCIIHAFASPGWEDRDEFPSFDAWMEHEKLHYLPDE